MSQEIKQFITGRKIRSEYAFTKLELELSRSFDNIQDRFAHDVIKRFTDQMIADRMKDMVVEIDHNNQTKFKLELFVFNRHELDEFIKLIKSTK